MLRILKVENVVGSRRAPIDADTLAKAAAIVDDVRRRGEDALREHAKAYGDLAVGAPLTRSQAELQAALDDLPAPEREALIRTAARIRRFAEQQRAGLVPLDTDIPGGRAGHTIVPVARAGCYAPGGRFPLPSSVLMTAVCARAAGVASVWVASPRPAPATLAAAAVAGVDGFLAVGGAQAIGALAHGAGPVPACDVVVGPGNRWVTAAKQVVAGSVGIDMLAGPSELVVLADATADPAVVASDLLAQAEHDVEALPVLVALDRALIDRVNQELSRQLEVLPTRSIAGPAIAHGFAVHARDRDEAVAVCDALAPEHLEVITAAAPDLAARLSHYGALFVGGHAAEVFGDYGAGPNHVLPTGGTARFSGGLSVFTFLRVRTWLDLQPGEAADAVARDAVTLARMEGLEGHARAAELRLQVRSRP